MHLVTLSSEARAHLVGQLDNSQQRRSGFLCAFPLDDTSDKVMDVVQLMVTPSAAEWHVWVSLVGHITTVAIPFTSATPERITQIIEDHVNSHFATATDVSVILHARCDLELTVKIAVLMNQGTFLIPSLELSDLYLVIEQVDFQTRPDFRFILNGISLTIPVPLPLSKELACKLILGCTNTIIKNHSNGWGG